MQQEYEKAVKKIDQLEADLERSRREVQEAQNSSSRDQSISITSPKDLHEDDESATDLMLVELCKLQAKKVNKNNMMREELLSEIEAQEKELQTYREEKSHLDAAILELQNKIDAHKQRIALLDSNFAQAIEKLAYFQTTLKKKEEAWRIDNMRRMTICKLLEEPLVNEEPSTAATSQNESTPTKKSNKRALNEAENLDMSAPKRQTIDAASQASTLCTNQFKPISTNLF